MDFSYRSILQNDDQLGPYPLEKLKRVDEPTTKYVSEPLRRRAGDNVFRKAFTGGYGSEIQARAPFFTTREPLDAAFIRVQDHMKAIPDNPVAAEKAPIPSNPRILSRHFKALGYFLGADMVGIAPVPEYARYIGEQVEKRAEGLNYAIVFLKVKHTRTVRASYGNEWIDDPVSMQVYQQLALIGEIMAGYIRNLGWQADADVVQKYTTLITPLLIHSGLGEGCRLGIALNPFVGANFKAAAVLTDLPLEADKPIDFGLQEYCAGCDICARQCPVGAISKGGKTVYNGYETWKLNSDACMINAQMNPHGSICQRCAKVCPWNRPDSMPGDFKDWDGDLNYLYNSVNSRAAYLKEHDFVDEEYSKRKWWFDLVENREGELVIPESSKYTVL